MSNMFVAYLNNLLLIVGIGSLFAILPRFSAYRTLFGTVVADGVLESGMAKLALRRYTRSIGIFTLCALGVSACGIPLGRRWLLVGGIVVVMLGGGGSYIVQWHRFRRHGAESDVHRVVSLRPAASMRANWIVNGAASFPLIGAAIYAAVRRGQLPATLPTHWGIDGHVNGWTLNTPFHIVRPAIVGLLALAFLNIMIWAIGSFGRIDRNDGDSTLRRTAFVIGAVSWMLSVNLALIMVLFVVGQPGSIFLGMLIADAAIVIVAFVLFRKMIRNGQMPNSTTNRDWKIGVFYWNPADSALLVPKRFGIGYTVNLAHPGGWLLGFGIPLIFGVTMVVLLRH